MEYSRWMRTGAAATAVAMAISAGLLGYTAWGNQSSSVTYSGGVATSAVTQLDRVTAMNASLVTDNDEADAEYYSAYTTETTTLLTVTQSSTVNMGLTPEDLTETGVILNQTTLYTKAEAEGDVVCYLLPGTVVTVPVMEDGREWYEVYYGTLCGYVRAEDLERGVDAADYRESTVLTYEDTYGVLLYDQTVYAEADDTAEALFTLEAGDSAQLLSAQDGWYTIYYYGWTGYISTDYIEQTAEAPAWKQAELEAEAEATLRANLVATAKEYLGSPYVWAAAGPNYFDCSGFTMYIMGLYGIKLTHQSGGQYANYGTWVSQDELQPGDLVFFGYSSVSHVGMYIGDGQFIHASSGSGYVTINNLSDAWYASRYIGAKNVIG